MGFLFSHSTKSEAFVAVMLELGLEAFLIPRLSRAAEQDLTTLLATLECVVLSNNLDTLSMSRCTGRRLSLSTAKLYKLCHFGWELSPHAAFIW
jgi:hypothetical protein